MIKQRIRTGARRTFDRRFEPLTHFDSTIVWPLPGRPDTDEDRYWWTIIEDNGRLYISPGFHCINRFSYVECRKCWRDDDKNQPNYNYCY